MDPTSLYLERDGMPGEFKFMMLGASQQGEHAKTTGDVKNCVFLYRKIDGGELKDIYSGPLSILSFCILLWGRFTRMINSDGVSY